MRLTVPEGVRRQRVDRVLASLVEGESRATIQRWITEGRVTIDGRICRPKEVVSSGEVVDVEPGPPPPSRAEPDPMVQFEVLHEDEQIVVVNKPAGLVVHPGRGHADGTLINGLLARPGFGRPPSDERDPEGPLRPGIVHRIDKDTSGILVVAKSPVAREALKEQFQAHTIGRTYLALTQGVPENGRIETLYGRHPRQRIKFTSLNEQGKTAITHVRVVRELSLGTALVECRLETGRTHQIRVHLAEQAKTPILCDAVYGAASHDPSLAAICRQLGRQALHAATLEVEHPSTGVRLRFESRLPKEMDDALAALTA